MVRGDGCGLALLFIFRRFLWRYYDWILSTGNVSRTEEELDRDRLWFTAVLGIGAVGATVCFVWALVDYLL